MDGQVQMQHDLARDGGGCVCMSKTLPGVAGEWWWASNECASLPKEGPLGPVLKRSHSRLWVTRWVTVSKCGNVTGFRTCVAAPGCGKMEKNVDGKMYGGHIMVHQPWKGGKASVHMQGLCELAWCVWCRLGGGQLQSSTWTFQQCTKMPLGTGVEMCIVGRILVCCMIHLQVPDPRG